MTQLLRDELARLADRAPDAHPAPDTWSRGRRARTRDRAAVAAAALVVLLVLGGATTLLTTAPGRVAPAAPTGGVEAVPSALHAVPAEVQLDPTAYVAGLATGTQAAAFVGDRGAPVVVSATDGSYRLLDLPGWPWRDADLRAAVDDPALHPLALSPDGTHLAWTYLDADGETGVRDADLATGEVREIPVVGADEAGPQQLVQSVTWSPSGSWLAWGAGVASEPGVFTAGLVAPGSEDTQQGNIGEGSALLTVDDDGRLVRATSDYVHVSGGGLGAGFSSVSTLDPPAVGAASPDGGRVVVGSVAPRGFLELLVLDRKRVEPAPLEDDSYPAGMRAAPLGWVDDRSFAILADADRRPVDEVLVVAAPGADAARLATTAVTQVPVESQDSLTLAVDLLGGPTVDRSAPEWPWSTARRLAVGGGATGVALLALGLAVVVRRRPAVR